MGIISQKMEKQKFFTSVLQLTTNKENIGALQTVGITTTKIPPPHGDIVPMNANGIKMNIATQLVEQCPDLIAYFHSIMKDSDMTLVQKHILMEKIGARPFR